MSLSTVEGTFKLPDGVAYTQSPVVFRHRETPLVDHTDIVATNDVVAVTDTLGELELGLVPGAYDVYVGHSAPFMIDVPTSTVALDIEDLIVSDILATSLLDWEEASLPPLATTTMRGTVFTSSNSAHPVALLVDDGVLRAPPHGFFRFKNGNELQLWDFAILKWRSVWLYDGELRCGAGEI